MPQRHDSDDFLWSPHASPIAKEESVILRGVLQVLLQSTSRKYGSNSWRFTPDRKIPLRESIWNLPQISTNIASPEQLPIVLHVLLSPAHRVRTQNTARHKDDERIYNNNLSFKKEPSFVHTQLICRDLLNCCFLLPASAQILGKDIKCLDLVRRDWYTLYEKHTCR